MSSSQAYYYTPAPLPIAVPKKQGYYSHPQQGYYSHPQQSVYGHMSMSPPEAPESVTASSGITSYDPSATSSSYAASASDYESTGGVTSSVDLLDYMSDRLNGSFDPLPLDRSLAKQAQTSGELNAKTRELMELQALAQSRLAATRASFAEGMKAAKEVQRDLEWTQKRVTALNERAARKYPAEYQMASARYPAPVDY